MVTRHLCRDSTTLFVFVAQAGKFYRVGFFVSGDEVVLGKWLQMTRLFVPGAIGALCRVLAEELGLSIAIAWHCLGLLHLDPYSSLSDLCDEKG